MRLFSFRIFIIICLLFFLFPETGQSVEELHVSAHNAILMEQSTGRVIFEKGAHEKRPVASITKVMTAIIALEHGDLNDQVLVSERAVHMNGSSIYLEKDEELPLEDLLYGLMLRSGNDASVAIAEHVGGSLEGFVYLMNEKARYLGMTNTHFENPHGLDEKGHYSSAYDIAILMKYAMENEVFKTISNTKSYQSKNRDYKWNNKNKLLTQFYEPCTGGKTGFTNKAGRTLVTTAKKDHLSLIVVTLNASDDWNDHMSLYENGFDQFKLVKLDRKGEKTFMTEGSFISGYLEDDVIYPLKKEEQTELTKQAILKGETTENEIGKIVYSIDSNPIIEVPVYRYEKESSHFLTGVIEAIKKILRFDKDG